MTGVAKLALGTVQFGLSYGATHAGGLVPETEVARILDMGKQAGIDTLDTAAGYGDAERVLGRVGAGHDFRIITKTASGDLAGITQRFQSSLAKLGVATVDGVLVHAIGDLTSAAGDALWSAMQRWKRDGLARRIGVSVYDRADIDAVMGRFVPDIVQLPLSALDQRLLADGSLERLAASGVAVHLRSAFLQGLMLQPAAATPPRLSRTMPYLTTWHAACRKAGTTPLAAALGFALGLRQVERVVIGVHTAEHLQAIIAAAAAKPPDLDWSSLAVSDAEAVDPRRWPT
jgi:aryl-alcohol dehydrogenase-like predicted oxidoreductase